jgi:hypothetical protein
MTELGRPAAQVIRLRYAGTCTGCHIELAAGTRAAYDRATKRLTCAACVAAAEEFAGQGNATRPVVQASVPVPGNTHDGSMPGAVEELRVQAGTAGASAAREYQREKATRESRIRSRFPRLGGLLLAIVGEPQRTQAWATGARGEEIVGAMLDRLAERSVHALHDRRIPGSRANIDHIAVASSGVFVIDAKRYKGQPRLRVEGGLFRPRIERLFVAGRDRTPLVASVHKQIGLVTRALSLDGHAGVPILGKLCFVDADWPLLARSFKVQGVEALSPKALRRQLLRDGPLNEFHVRDIHRSLALAFPEA